METNELRTVFVLVLGFVLFIGGTLAIHPLFMVDETNVPIDLGEMPILSNAREGTIPGARVNIEAYIDYQCIHCQDLVLVLERIMTVYGKHVNVRIRHFPQYEHSLQSALAVECARMQGTFWAFHRELHANPDKVGTANLIIIADDLNLDTERFISCLEEQETLPFILEDKEEGVRRLVRGTPTVFIEGWMVEGMQPFTAYKEKIDLEMME